MTHPLKPNPGQAQHHAERTQARVLALQYLYARDVLKGDSTEDAGDFFDAEGVAARSVRDYAARVVAGVLEDQPTLDQDIQEAARNWSVGRMPAVDRNILRICWFEMRTLELPAAVAINEAIELGKEFSTENSGAFINGVLDQLNKTRLLGQPADAGDAADAAAANSEPAAGNETLAAAPTDSAAPASSAEPAAPDAPAAAQSENSTPPPATLQPPPATGAADSAP
ncbi:MAG: transcription antitermination factor NusB [Planctomycetota bacterium]